MRQIFILNQIKRTFKRDQVEDLGAVCGKTTQERGVRKVFPQNRQNEVMS